MHHAAGNTNANCEPERRKRARARVRTYVPLSSGPVVVAADDLAAGSLARRAAYQYAPPCRPETNSSIARV